MKWKFKSPTFMCIFETVSMHAIKIFLFHEAGKLCEDLEFWRKPNVKNSVRDTLKGPKLFSTLTLTLFILFSILPFQSAVSEGLDEWIQYTRCERHISFHRWVVGEETAGESSSLFYPFHRQLKGTLNTLSLKTALCDNICHIRFAFLLQRPIAPVILVK